MEKIKIILPFLIIIALFFLSGCGGKVEQGPPYKLDLEIWGVFDNTESFTEIIKNYKEANKNITSITYRKFSSDMEKYKSEVIEAMAENNPPDIFIISNTWLPAFKNKIEPAPAEFFGESNFTGSFPDAAATDFIDRSEEKINLGQKMIYAVPLTMDSLALYYNKDIFNAEGFVSPPQTWEEFSRYAKRMTRKDSFGNITQAGAAMGTSSEVTNGNINRAPDILMALMMQKGTNMTDESNKKAAFEQSVDGGDGTRIKAGEEALEFYTQFARSNSEFYSWNTLQHTSSEAFAEGNLAMMINYSWLYDTVRVKNSKLNFAVAQLPQFEKGKTANMANYYGFAVAKNRGTDGSLKAYEAWQFLKFLTTKNNGKITIINGKSKNRQDFPVKIDPAKKYLELTRKPAVRRDLIEEQKNDPILGPFAYGNLIAKSWRQSNPAEIEKIFSEMIRSVNFGDATIDEALTTASNRATQMMNIQ